MVLIRILTGHPPGPCNWLTSNIKHPKLATEYTQDCPNTRNSRILYVPSRAWGRVGEITPGSLPGG